MREVLLVHLGGRLTATCYDPRFDDCGACVLILRQAFLISLQFSSYGYYQVGTLQKKGDNLYKPGALKTMSAVLEVS